MKKEKYDAFSKVFSKLSDESQEKLVKIAHRLLKTHKFVKSENGKHKSTVSQTLHRRANSHF